MSRRAIFGAGLAGMALVGAGMARFGWSTDASVTLAGVRVRRWGCQYQNIRTDALGKTDLDLVVLDQVVEGRQIEPEAVSALKRKPNGERRLVLAYLSVGEAESYRAYWRPSWQKSAPSWIGPENRNWPGSFSVRYWDPGWQELLIGSSDSLLGTIIDSGFDGVFLDRVDAYADWAERGEVARAEMIKLVQGISREGKARQNRFVIMAQNAEPCLVDPHYTAAIDAVSKESLLFGLTGPEQPNSEQDVAWSLSYLRHATERGLPILSIEYLSSERMIMQARRRCNQLGFVPFFGTRLLDRVPI